MNNNDGHFENDLACAYISKHHQLLVTMSTKAILERIPKGVIRIRKSKKDRQHNEQKKKDKQ